MNLIFIVLGLNFYAIFVLKRSWLLEIKPYTILFAFNLCLFIAAHLFQYKHLENNNFTAALKIPAPQQLLFLALLLVYRGIFKKDPADTLWSMDWKLIKDGVFNFIFFVSSLLPTILALDNSI